MVLRLQMKLGEPSVFNGGKREGKQWLLQLERYFAAMGLNAAVMEDSGQMCTIAVSLLRGNAAMWYTKLEKFDLHPTTFKGFKENFL